MSGKWKAWSQRGQTMVLAVLLLPVLLLLVGFSLELGNRWFHQVRLQNAADAAAYAGAAAYVAQVPVGYVPSKSGAFTAEQQEVAQAAAESAATDFAKKNLPTSLYDDVTITKDVDIVENADGDAEAVRMTVALRQTVPRFFASPIMEDTPIEAQASVRQSYVDAADNRTATKDAAMKK